MKKLKKEMLEIQLCVVSNFNMASREKKKKKEEEPAEDRYAMGMTPAYVLAKIMDPYFKEEFLTIGKAMKGICCCF